MVKKDSKEVKELKKVEMVEEDKEVKAPAKDFIEEITSRRGKTITKRIYSDGVIEEL